MNILRFIEEFPDEESCKSNFKNSREKKEFFVRNVDVLITNGFKLSGNGNINRTSSEPLYTVTISERC